MRKLLYSTTLAMLAMLMFAPAAFAQQGPACPAGQVNVLQSDGTFICVPANIEDQTPEQVEAAANDPRSSAETPIDNQQVLDFSQLTPAQARAAGFDVPAGTGDTCPPGTVGSGDQGAGEFACVPSGEAAPATAPAPAAPTAPAQTSSTDVTVMPDTGGPALLMPLLGVLLLAGGLVMRRR